MLRLVDRLAEPNDDWGGDSLRLRILKQFIKYGNYLADAGVKGKKAVIDYASQKAGIKLIKDDEVLRYIDDKIFDLIDCSQPQSSYAGLSQEEAKKQRERQKERRKSARKKNELLYISDDLAYGKFRSEGSTKKSLYFFAMAFRMTYYPGVGVPIDPNTDIETNLFRDYYTNNLIRFITNAYKGRLAEYEPDPSGQGINFKNFAEVIYLYFISKDCSPQEKIKGSLLSLPLSGLCRICQGVTRTAHQVENIHIPVRSRIDRSCISLRCPANTN